MTETKQWITFPDYYGHEVRLALLAAPFSDRPGHVWVLCRFHRQWLLTMHGARGLEFPGGKLETGEEPAEAARREVEEETGARVAAMYFIGQYQVDGREGSLEKNIYFAEIDRMTLKSDYLETDGPRLVDGFPDPIRQRSDYSFIMKDQVLVYALAAIRNKRWMPVFSGRI